MGAARRMTRYRLGLPAWAFPGWKDRYFSDRPSPLASYTARFDVNLDGLTNIVDLGILSTNFNKSAQGAASVPEPSAR